MGLTDFSFTPSEMILLHGDVFSPEVSNNGHQLLCNDGMVNDRVLASMMLAASILANVEENGMSIELKEKKKLFSSRADASVYIHPVGQAPKWNGYTLETAILYSSGQYFAMQGEYTVYNVVYSILLEDRKDPWNKVIEFVEWGLASSNWLMPVEGDAASAFLTPFICPEKVRDLAFSQSLDPVKQLIIDCKKNTPNIWKLMMEEIERAFDARKI